MCECVCLGTVEIEGIFYVLIVSETIVFRFFFNFIVYVLFLYFGCKRNVGTAREKVECCLLVESVGL